MKKGKTYEVKISSMEDIERIAKEIREDLGLGECDCMKPKLEIDVDEANQILQWWGLSDSFHGDKLAAKLEDFVTQNQSSTSQEEK